MRVVGVSHASRFLLDSNGRMGKIAGFLISNRYWVSESILKFLRGKLTRKGKYVVSNSKINNYEKSFIINKFPFTDCRNINRWVFECARRVTRPNPHCPAGHSVPENDPLTNAYLKTTESLAYSAGIRLAVVLRIRNNLIRLYLRHCENHDSLWRRITPNLCVLSRR